MTNKPGAFALCLVVGLLVACMPQPSSRPTATPVVSATAGSGPPTATSAPPAATTVFATAVPQASPSAAAATAVPVASPSATAGPAASATAGASGIGVRLGETFTLKVGQWANVLDGSDTRVFLTSIREDTRCALKPATPCNGVGRALAAMSIESNGKLAQFNLSTNIGEFHAVDAFEGYVVRLIDVAPYPQQTEPKIALADYQVTFNISAGSLAVPLARFDEPFSLKPGQTIGVEGSSMRLTFVGVSQDSRCPARVACVVAGSATVAIDALHDGLTDHYALEVGGNGVMTKFPAVRTVAVNIYASALMPYPQQGAVAPGDYQVTLVINNPAMPLPSATPRKP